MIRRNAVAVLAAAFLQCATIAGATNKQADSVLARIYGPEEREAVMSIRTLRQESKIRAFQMEGVGRGVYMSPDNLAQTISFPMLEVSQIYSGDSAWLVDQNRNVTPMSADETKMMSTATYLMRYGFLDPSDSATREYLGVSKRAGRGCHDFRLAPAGGLAAVVAIDSLTGDILYSRMKRDDLTMETRYDDFRELSGIRFPFHAKVTSSTPLLNSEEWVQEIQVNPEVNPAEFRVSKLDSPLAVKSTEDASRKPGYRFPEGQSRVSIAFEYVNNHIFVNARINNAEPIRLLLDSGAGTTTLSSKLARRLGLEIHGELPAKGVSGYQALGIIHVEEIDLGEVALLNQTVAAIDFDSLTGLALGGADGIIGYELLNQFPTQIDFVARQVTLFNPDSSPMKFPGEALAIGFESKIPTVRAALGEFSGEFLVDLGNSVGIMIHDDFAQEVGLDKLVREQKPRGVVSGVGGQTRIREFNLPEFSLGGLTLRDLPALVMEAGRGMASSESLSGNLGTPFLDDFLLTIDYRCRRIWLAPLD